jgi:hypothetical protein
MSGSAATPLSAAYVQMSSPLMEDLFLFAIPNFGNRGGFYTIAYFAEAGPVWLSALFARLKLRITSCPSFLTV